MNKQVWKRSKGMAYSNKAGNGIVEKKGYLHLS
jgi:hypothetical protein